MKTKNVGSIRLLARQRSCLCAVLNHFITDGPVATEQQLDFFTIDFARECVRRALDTRGLLTADGAITLRIILGKLI